MRKQIERIREMQTVVNGMDRQAVKRLLHLIPSDEILMIKEPDKGLIMISVKDSFDTPFHLGEILTTAAEVEYRGENGFGMVMGDDPEKALASAAVEAVLLSDNDLISEKIERMLRNQEKKLSAAKKKEQALLVETRVNFETMVKR